MLLTFDRSGIYQETVWSYSFRPIILLYDSTYDCNFVMIGRIRDCQITTKEHRCFRHFLKNLAKVRIQFKSCCTELETSNCFVNTGFNYVVGICTKTVLAKLIHEVPSNILSLCETVQSCRAQVAVRNNSQADSP